MKPLILKDVCTPRFTAALFTTATMWKQLKCPLMGEWKRICDTRTGCIHSGILLSHEKDKSLPFATTWMSLEGIMLNKVSQRKATIIRFHSHVEYEKQKINTHTK